MQEILTTMFLLNVHSHVNNLKMLAIIKVMINLQNEFKEFAIIITFKHC